MWTVNAGRSDDVPGNGSAAVGQLAESRLYRSSETPHSRAHTVVAAPLLLQISNDMHLARSREPLIRNAGFLVRSVHSGAVAPATSETDFDCSVALFCQSVPPDVASAIAFLLRISAPRALIARLTRNESRETMEYDRMLQAPIRPALLSCEIARLRTMSATRDDLYE